MYLMDQLVLVGNTTAPGDSLHAFADYVYHHFDSIKDLSIDELAHACALSAPTVSRLVSRLGFESYRSFREQCAALTQRYGESHDGYDHFLLTPGNAVETFSHTIAPALSRVTDEQIELFLRYLLPKEACSYVIGLANMHAVAEGIQYAVAGFRSHDILAPGNFRAVLNAHPEDTVIVLSTTGNAFLSTSLGELLRGCRARRLLVTTNNFDYRDAPVHDVIVLRSPARQHLINNYLMQGFVDMALCRAGLYD